MSNDEYRAEQQEARQHGLRARQETRRHRAQTVIGELGQQIHVIPEGAYARVVVANKEGEHLAALRLHPEAAERLAKILLQTKAIVEASA